MITFQITAVKFKRPHFPLPLGYISQNGKVSTRFGLDSKTLWA